MDKDKAIRSAKLTAAGILDKARAKKAVQRAGGQIAPSKFMPEVPRQVHAAGGKVAESHPFMQHLQQASDDMGHGFGFEEGGCLGMAHALAEEIGGRIAASKSGFKHYYAEKNGNLYDYTGKTQDKEGHTITSLPEAMRDLGSSQNDHDVDKANAKEVIEEAKSRVQGSATGGRAVHAEGGAVGYVPRGWGPLQQLPAASLPTQSRRPSSLEQIASITDAFKPTSEEKPEERPEDRDTFRSNLIASIARDTVGSHMDANAAPPRDPAAAPAVNYDGVSGSARAALEALQKGWGGQSLNVISSYRDPKKNEDVGGAKGSQHLHGNAFDFDTSGWTPEQKLALATEAYNAGFRGFGFYNNNLHFDVGGERAWGPDYHSTSIPDWANPWVQQYLRSGRANGGKVAFMQDNHPLVPDVLYHGNALRIAKKGWTDEIDPEGTRRNMEEQNFKEFKPSAYGNYGPGIYLTDKPEVASDFAQGIRADQKEAMPFGQVMKLHVSMKQPFHDDYLKDPAWVDYIKQALTKHSIAPHEKAQRDAILQKLDGGTATVRDLFLSDTPDGTMVNQFGQNEIHDTIRRSGFDGIIAHHPNGSKEYVAFKPEQVKSALSARKFDPTSPDMTYADGGAVTDSDEFRNWFGNSVTHTDGEPHVFYTGTSKDKDFTSHNVGRHGAWFTRDPDIASEYAEQNDSQGYKWDGGRPVSVNTASRVIPAYVKAENPYTGELPDEYVGNNYKALQSAWFDTLRAKGHDAWMPESHGGNLVVALKEPQQIKSIFNNGKFDPKQKHMNKAEGGAVEQPANGMHMLRMRRAGINTKDDFWGRWRDHMMAKAGPDMRLSAMGSNDSHSQRVDGLINTHRQEADSSGIRGVLQRYGTNENGIISARMPREILQSAGIEPTVDNASSIYHSLPDDESGRLGKAGGGEIDGLGNNNQLGGTQDEAAPTYPATRPQAGEFPGSGGVRGGAGLLQAPNETSLEGLPRKVRIPLTGKTITASHDPRIRQVARDYMASAGLPYSPPTKYAKVDRNRAARISDAYDAMKDNADDPLTKASYAAMIRETMAQYKAAKDAGFKAEFWNPKKQKDPYGASPRLATEDIRNNHHMWVYPTHAGYGSGKPISKEDIRKNPMLQLTGETWNGIPVTVNDVFRAVHDYYGHAKEGLGFRHDGEENAWRAHASMFTPLARMAMTSETRGQNSWLNFGPHGEKNRTARTEDTVFAPQKVGILPHWAHHEGAEDFMQPEEIEAMQRVRENYNSVVKKALDVTRRFTKDGSGATMSLKSKG